MHQTPVRVLHMIASLNVGGSQAMVMNLYRAFDREKIQFDFIIDHPNETELKQEIEKMGGRVYVLPCLNSHNYLQVRKAWDQFFSAHPEYKIFHTHSRSYACLYLPLAQKHGLTTIAHSHSTSNGKGWKACIKDLLQLAIRYQADYFFACSKQAGKWLFGKRLLEQGKIQIIKNAIDAESFRYDPNKREEIRQELGLREEFVVGNVGRLMPPKNHAFLLRIFAELRKQEENSKLLLVGDGDLLEELRKEAQGLGIQNDVIFAGSQMNVADYYQAMDAFVFPSLWEGLGIAAIEAQASGLHCVVSDIVPKEVDMGRGLVEFLPLDADVSRWAEAIGNIKGMVREEATEEIKKAGFDIKENAEKMQEFYLSLCS